MDLHRQDLGRQRATVGSALLRQATAPQVTARWLIAAALLAIFALAPAKELRAANKVRIALMSRSPKGVSAGQAAWIQRFLRWSLRKHRRIHVMKDTTVEQKLFEEKKPAATGARIRVMKRFLSKAKALYRMTRFPMNKRCSYALRALRVSNKMAEKVRNHLSSPRLLKQLYLYYAMAYLGLRKQQETLKWSLRLAVLDIDFDPSSEPGVPSSYTAYFQRLVGWLKARPKYTMVIDSVPSGAKLYHNFQYVGRTPYTLRGLLRGKHTIRLTRRGYKGWERTANLDPKKMGSRRTIKAKVPLKRDPNALTLKGIPIFAQDAAISDDILDRLEKIVNRLEIKHLYIVEPRRVGANNILKIAIFNKGKRQIKYRTLLIGKSRNTYRRRITGYARALANQIAPAPIARRAPRPARVRRVVPRRNPSVVYRPPPRRRIIRPTPVRPITPQRRPTVIAAKQPRRPLPPPNKSKGGTPFYSTWWFWTATIGGAVVAATTVVLVANMNGPPPSATLIITTNPPATP